MNIFVTGCAGFIGANLCKKLLDNGNKVIGIDNLNNYYNPVLKKLRLKKLIGQLNVNFAFFNGDICQQELLKKIFLQYKVDSIIHLAAQAGVKYSCDNPWAYIKSNVEGTLNILEFARQYNKKLIIASSSSVYGKTSKIPFIESDPCNNPISIYAATKKSAEMIAQVYHNLYGLKIIILRLFTVYGPWGRPDMAIYKFVSRMISGEKIIINGLNTKRDFTYIDDITDGIIKATTKDINFEIINLGNNKPISLKELVELLENILNKKATLSINKLPNGDVPLTYADITKAKNILDWQPKIPIKTGLINFINWYKKDVIGNILLS